MTHPVPVHTARGFGAAAVAPHELSTLAAIEIMAGGGNAVDDAIAANAVQGTCSPWRTAPEWTPPPASTPRAGPDRAPTQTLSAKQVIPPCPSTGRPPSPSGLRETVADPRVETALALSL